MKYTILYAKIKFFLICSPKNYVNDDFNEQNANQCMSRNPGLKLPAKNIL